MTAPIQPASQTASPTRAAKAAANSTGLPFNSVLTQEVAQRNGEPPRAERPASERRGTEGPDADKTVRSEQAQKAVEKSADSEKSTAEDTETIDATIAAAPPEILALVAEFSQFTGKTPAIDAASATTVVETEAKSGKQVASNPGKADVSDNSAAIISSDTPEVSLPNLGTDARTQDFAATFLRTAPSSMEPVSTGSQPLDGLSSPLSSSVDTIVPMQQASATFSAQAVATASDKLMPPVGTPAWDQALGNKVVWMAGTAVQTASLTLNPPDLGPLQVVLNVSNNQATAAFSAAQPEVRQALEAAMPRLRELMQEAGIQLSEATVDAGTSGRQEMADRGAQSGFRKSPGPDIPGVKEQIVSVARQQPVMRGQGLVDTFA